MANIFDLLLTKIKGQPQQTQSNVVDFNTGEQVAPTVYGNFEKKVIRHFGIDGYEVKTKYMTIFSGTKIVMETIKEMFPTLFDSCVQLKLNASSRRRLR